MGGEWEMLLCLDVTEIKERSQLFPSLFRFLKASEHWTSLHTAIVHILTSTLSMTLTTEQSGQVPTYWKSLSQDMDIMYDSITDEVRYEVNKSMHILWNSEWLFYE